jgi:adenosylcobinamide kinase/adenosylcobinamide-phosphate guanylyltransferase
MQQRVVQHQNERGQSWQTVEAPVDLGQAVIEQSRDADLILVDCLTLWISNLMLDDKQTAAVSRRIAELLEALENAACPVLIVSNEVGNGIVPENQLARQYRDLVGSVNQAVARVADRVVWVVAGIPVNVKG